MKAELNVKGYGIIILKKFLKVFYLFPINKKLITVVSFHGDSYTCSPKYITEYILDNYTEYKIVWAFNEPKKFIGNK